MSATCEIVVTKGALKGQVFSLAGGALTIGRDPGNALVIPEERIAPHHARIEVSFAGVTLKELGARNGTYVGHERVVGSKKLMPGVEVRLGDTAFELRERRVADRRAADREVVIAPAASAAQGNITRAQRNLAVLHQVGDLLSTERDADRFLARMMKLLFDVLRADRGVLLLVGDDGELTPRLARNSARGGEEVAVSRTILSKVLDGKSVLTADAGADPQLASGSSIFAQSIRSAMCVPVRSRQTVRGAIYLDTVVSVGVFTNDDLEMLSIVGSLTGTALDNIALVKENVQRERMAAIGMVVAGLGHDVRNLLTALGCGMQLLGRSLKDPASGDVDAAWDVVTRSQESIAALVLDMLAYSKEREPERELADFNQVVQSAVAFVETTAAARQVAVTMTLDTALVPFYFDAR
jgi:two-component system NtrC family sensor kinase